MDAPRRREDEDATMESPGQAPEPLRYQTAIPQNDTCDGQAEAAEAIFVLDCGGRHAEIRRASFS